jgi:protoporphyrinogen oxidase
MLAKAGFAVTVLEADPVHVGGIARTVTHRSQAVGGQPFRFDIGGHRFFSKSREVEDLWTEILGDDMLVRPRKSRILYGGRCFDYPLRASQALINLGAVETARCALSYLAARAFPVRDPRSFEDWVSNCFGRRLYRIFFKTYTEKVWGMSCKDISADWAAQRIKGLSLSKAAWNALWPRLESDRSRQVKTLISSFRYPRLGPGMMWERAAQRVRDMGGEIRMGCRCNALELLPPAAPSPPSNAPTSQPRSATWRVHCTDASGAPSSIDASHVICSAPLGEVVSGLTPRVPAEVLHAAAQLKYRDFLTVALVVRPVRQIDDNWLYVHEPGVKVGRIQNFGAWSPEMIPDERLACYGLEYFCFEGDGLWAMEDRELVILATRELAELGLARESDVLDGVVVRQPKAYPVYDAQYMRHVGTIRAALEERYPGLYPVGRNGMHKYNNQDHSMMTAMLAVRNIVSGGRRYDIWTVNEDAEYHESGPDPGRDADSAGASGLRAVPRSIRETGSGPTDR